MSAHAAAGRRIRLGHRRLRISRRRLRLLLAVFLVAALAAVGGWFLLRNSSLVAVEHVTVTGVQGSDAAAITAALDVAAHKMTTLDVQTARLRAAVVGFPDIKGLTVGTSFPHGLAIHVIQVLPVAVVHAPGMEVVVAADGTLLPHVPVSGGLPVIKLAAPPTGSRLYKRWALAAATLLATAPSRLLARLAEVSLVWERGLVVQLRNGPSIYFGDAAQLQAKWAAAVAVLADPGSAGASYIDVTDPARPAAGTDAAAAAGAGLTAAGEAGPNAQPSGDPTSGATTGTPGSTTGDTGGATGTAGGATGDTGGATGAAGPTTGG